ncbi:MAG: adenosylcobinamide-GDP ribazoletransferase [Pseudomonadota bacterium]
METPNGIRILWHDIRHAMALMTRIPVSLNAEYANSRGAAFMWAFPLIGAMVGSLAFCAAALGKMVLPFEITGFLVLLTCVMVTGAIHEDGLADCADGFWGGWTPARRLEIMKDSAIGAYGVIALILSFGVRYIAITSLVRVDLEILLIPLAVASRVWILALMRFMTPAGEGGLAKSYGKPPIATCIAALMIGILCILPFAPIAWMAVLGGAMGTLVVANYAQTKIKGYTGDVLGASQVLAEITSLLVLLALI